MASAASTPANVLAYGSVNGHIDKLLKTIAKALTQRPFAAVFIAGDLFGASANESDISVADSVLNGSLAFPIPTFFVAGKSPLPTPILDRIKAVRHSHIEVVQVATNLFFCSGSGIHIEPNSGLRFAYLSGTFDPTRFSVPADPNVPHRYTSQLIDHLLATPDEHIPLDILLTYESPVNMATQPAHAPLLAACQSPALTSVVNTLMPRYHFCGGPGVFVERAPFAHFADLNQVGERDAHFTRFLSIAPVPGPGEKPPTGAKWAYAFALLPFMLKFGQDRLESLPDGCTPSPLAALSGPLCTGAGARGENKRGQDQHDDVSEPAADAHLGKRPRYDRPSYDPLQDCWFCLPCAKADRNLVFAVGKHMYGAVAKGQLLPGHVLFVPRAHVQSWHRIQSAPTDDGPEPPVDQAMGAMQELCSMQRLASEMHAREGKVTVTWQIMDLKPNGAMHAHCQVVPVEVGEEERQAVDWMLKRLLSEEQEDQAGEQDKQGPAFIAVDDEMQQRLEEYMGPVSPTLDQSPTEPTPAPTPTVIDRIAAAFTTKLAAFNLHPITYRILSTPTCAYSLGSLTSTLYHLRAHQLVQINDPNRPRNAPRIHIVNPCMRHIAMLAGDRLLFVPIHDHKLRFPFSLPREAVASALGMSGESALWRNRAGEEGEREKEYAVARALARKWSRAFGESEATGVEEVDERLVGVGAEQGEDAEKEAQVQRKEYDLSRVELDRSYFQRNGGWTWDHFAHAQGEEEEGHAKENGGNEQE